MSSRIGVAALGICILASAVCRSQGLEGGTDHPRVRGSYFGQPPPGDTPTIFAVELAGIEPNTHSSPVFSPDGEEVFITVMGDGPNRIKYSRMDADSVWAPLADAPFSSRFSDSNPFLSADGSRIYFKSYRPENGKGSNGIWVSEKVDGAWSDAVPLDPVFMQPGLAWQSSISELGTVYFPLETGEQIDIYYSERIDGRYTNPKSIGDAVNSDVPDWQTCIAPDESYLIFASNNREGGHGWGDLYVSFRDEDGSWTEAVNMGPEINTRENEEWPSLTPDGERLVFRRCEYSNDYRWYYLWVDTGVVDELRP